MAKPAKPAKPAAAAAPATPTSPAGPGGKVGGKASGKAGGKASGKGSGKSVLWIDAPEDHDFPAAASYLSLLTTQAVADAAATAFQSATDGHFKAKDILRAARLDLLPLTNPHVKSDLAKVAAGKPLSPVLLVRGDAAHGIPALIADGYHRVCASYHTDENTDVPVRIIELPATPTV